MKLKQDLSLRSLLVRSLVVTGVMVLLGCTENISAQWTSPSPNPDNNIYYNGGNVGIGTTTPGIKLDVQISSSNYAIRALGSSAAVGVGVIAAQSGAKALAIEVAGGAGEFLPTAVQGDAMLDATGNNLLFATVSTERMRVNSSGNVGIGTASPTYKLDVQGTGGGQLSVKRTDAGNLRNVSEATNGNVEQHFLYSSNQDWVLGLDKADSNKFKLSSADDSFGTGTRFTVQTNGNVGIGTTNPGVKLEVAAAGGEQLRVTGPSNPYLTITDTGGVSAFLQAASGAHSVLFGSTTNHLVAFYTNGTEKMQISPGGNVGIGTTAGSTYKLDVNGNTNVTGNITLSGTINAKYQDVAEWVPSSEQITTGTVVVLDSTKSNQVISSTQAYDTRVAGVVSAQPGLALGERGEDKVLVATTGRVLVKVDASNGPIHIGDLLVTSDVRGVAMKSEPVTIGNRKIHMPGTLIGKALEPLENGSGKILVLLSLQ